MWQIAMWFLSLFVGKIITADNVKLLWSWIRPLFKKWADTTTTNIDNTTLDLLDKFFEDPNMLRHISDLISSIIRGKTPPAPIDPVNPPLPQPDGGIFRGIFRRIFYR